MNYTITAPTRPKAGDYKSGSLERITVKEITQILEMAPNVEDDPDKVANSWGFNAVPDDVELVFKHAFNERREFKPGWYRCAIWDYKGSQYLGKFSTYGEPDVFKFLFGDRYVEMY